MNSPKTLTIRNKILGVLIKDARIAAGKTIDDCAKIIGVSSHRIEGFEHGNQAPSLPELETLAFFLDVPLTNFWGQHSLTTSHQEKEYPNFQRLITLRTRIISVLLRKARLESGMSLSELAKCVNIPEEEIGSYEDGIIPIPLPTLEILSGTLNYQINFFFDKNGVIGEWIRQQKATQVFLELPSDLQNFVTKPINKPYLMIAQKMSGMSVEKLRALAEGLLDITL